MLNFLDTFSVGITDSIDINNLWEMLTSAPGALVKKL